jgi:hypothetical protein
VEISWAPTPPGDGLSYNPPGSFLESTGGSFLARAEARDGLILSALSDSPTLRLRRVPQIWSICENWSRTYKRVPRSRGDLSAEESMHPTAN